MVFSLDAKYTTIGIYYASEKVIHQNMIQVSGCLPIELVEILSCVIKCVLPSETNDNISVAAHRDEVSRVQPVF